MVSGSGHGDTPEATRSRALLVAWTGGVVVASLVPLPPGSLAPRGPLGVGVDAWLHVGAYAVLGFGAAAVQVSEHHPGLWRAVRGFAVAVGVGAGVEVVQLAVPARTFAVGDLLANGVGAALGVVGWLAIRRLRRRSGRLR